MAILSRKRETSIRFHLLIRLVVVSIVLVGATALFGYWDVKYEANELFDAQLARSARVILSIVESQGSVSGFSSIQQYLDENGLAVMYINFEEPADSGEIIDGHVYETKLAFQIWDDEGNLLVKSYNAPLEPITSMEDGYHLISVDGYQWRTFSLPAEDGKYHCITAERLDVRNDLINKISKELYDMFILQVLALTVIIYITAYFGLRPLQLLANQINRRSSENLELLAGDDKYTEINTIKKSLNQLLVKLNKALEREKRFTSDAAHELRTPLAAIRLHAELAKSARNGRQKDESLDHVLQSVDRATHMVEQLLVLARLDPVSLEEEFTSTDLASLITDVTAMLMPMAMDKNIDIEFDADEDGIIMGNETALRLLVQNLIKNAIVYTQENGKVKLSLSDHEGGVQLVVQDNGPGIPDEELHKVTERFYRSQNHDAPGCGIGLSIVDRVVQLHHGRLEFTCPEAGTGLKVVVWLRK